MSKLILTEMKIHGKRCTVSALTEEGRVFEMRISPAEQESILGNIYMGQVEKIAENIGAAFVRLAPGVNAYLPLKEAKDAIYSADRKGNAPIRPGDALLVQVCRAAMKGKLPAVTTNLNFSGKYLVLTSKNRTVGYSAKLSGDERNRLSKWLEESLEALSPEFGVIVRTNAAEASREAFQKELLQLKERWQRVTVAGRSRTCFSLLLKAEVSYMEAVRNVYTKELEEIVTDVPEIFREITEWSAETGLETKEKLRFYEEKLLPLYKLYRLEAAVEEIQRERVWLNSGGFLVIQQTEAFVSIDVNSGKYTGKKKAGETYRRINLEAAKEICRQIRLRNLSGIILIDFINMEQPQHREELFHVLQKYLRRDPVKAKAVDITPLHILEMTRQKVRRPVIEELKEL